MSIALLAADLAGKSGEAAKAGPIAFAVILVLCVACYFLFKSMSKHLKRVREGFPADSHPPADTPPAAAPPVPPSAAAPPASPPA